MNKLPPPPADYDENPEWTEEDFARARPADEVHPPHVVAALVRAPVDQERVTLELDRDILEQYQAAGPGWPERINAALRAVASTFSGTDHEVA